MKKVFISYSHADEDYKNRIITHLSGLKRSKLVEIWDDRSVKIGDEWDDEIKNNLRDSDIVLFLMSSDFLASEYINEKEINTAIELHKRKMLIIVPIFLRPCDFESSILGKFQGAPRDANCLSQYDCIDAGCLEIVKELKTIITDFKSVRVEKVDKKQKMAPSDIPPDITKWVGRCDEISILKSEHFKVVFITGFGGQGKSSLAAKYIHDEGDLFFSWDWRDFKEEESRLRTKLLQIIKRFSESEYDLEKLRESPYSVIVDEVFKVIDKKKILFVFDNIDAYIDYETFQPLDGFSELINSALNRKHNCKFIFTCRPFVKKADVGFYQIELKGISFDDTKTLLDKYNINIKKDEKDEIYKTIHEITKGHPLWLNILGAQAINGVSELNNFIKKISKHTTFNEQDVSKLLSDQILGVLWDTLTYKLQKLLRYFSEFVKSVNIDEIEKIVSKDFSYQRLNKALKKLKYMNLVVTKTNTNNEEEIELHPLVKSFIICKYPPKERSSFISVIIDYYNNITYVLKEKIHGDQSLDFFENWTNKIELAVNKNDYNLALSTLNEIYDELLTAGYVEEYYRICSLIFSTIDFQKNYVDETPFFINQLSNFIEITSELSKFEIAREYINKLKDIISSKGKDYITYCKAECYYNWTIGEYVESITWGEKALGLITESNIDKDSFLEHTLNLSKRDSLNTEYLNEAIMYFQKNEDLDIVINGERDINLGAGYYGNLGRCFFNLGEYEKSLKLYYKSFQLCYEEEISNRFVNRGFASYWLAQVLSKTGRFKIAYIFYNNCINYWKQYSPHRAKWAEEEMSKLADENSDLCEINKMGFESIEISCKEYVTKNYQHHYKKINA